MRSKFSGAMPTPVSRNSTQYRVRDRPTPTTSSNGETEMDRSPPSGMAWIALRRMLVNT